MALGGGLVFCAGSGIKVMVSVNDFVTTAIVRNTRIVFVTKLYRGLCLCAAAKEARRAGEAIRPGRAMNHPRTGERGYETRKLETSPFETCDELPQIVADPHRFLLRVVEHHNHRVAVRYDRLLLLAEDCMSDRHAAVAHSDHSSTDMHRIGIIQLPAIVAVDRGEYRSQSFAGHRMAEAESFEIGDARGFVPAEIDRVVHVPKRVLISPLDRPLNDDRKFAQRIDGRR